jgi:glycosyltransferase involved in cell wall biosynthesis
MTTEILDPAHALAGVAEASLGEVEISIVMPCLNEAETLGRCIERAQRALDEHGVRGEILIADNGSTDGSQEIATRLGARVVTVAERGYGSALMGGIAAARGRYVAMGDADDSYDFGDVPRFLEHLRGGAELVIGNRFAGGIRPGAMPFLHRYLGNPVLSAVGRLFFKVPCGDFHCGLRAFDRAAILRLDLHTTGMEFASEMIVKAGLRGLTIGEAPTSLAPDGRSRRPHLRTWRDGWRHLRFLLLYSPRWLFLWPGSLLIAAGVAGSAWLLPGPRRVGGVEFDVHSLLYAAMATIVGFQAVFFALFTKVFAMNEKLLPPHPTLERWLRRPVLEMGLALGLLLLSIGIIGATYAFALWRKLGFGPLDPSLTLRVVIPAVTAVTLGLQVMMGSFFLSVLGLRRR